MKTTDSRYPYTYAADYLRAFGGMGTDGVKMSRSDASQVRQAVANALGMSDVELAERLADFYIKNEQAVSERSMRELLQARPSASHS